jgi:hypothetical protein
MRELFGTSVELVQALPRAEPILTSGEDFRIAFVGFDLHSAHRIHRRPPIASSLHSVMAFMVMMPVHRMRAATEAHHEIKESREQKELEYPRIHRFSLRVLITSGFG